MPTTESVTIALRTQQIVAYESGLADTVDPLGGSYYVEALTNKIEAEAWEYIKKIDEIGGAPEAIAKGYIQKEIQDSAYKWQMDIEKGDRIIAVSYTHLFLDHAYVCWFLHCGRIQQTLSLPLG